MESKLLQPFLQAGLLDIGDSDERLGHIEKSIAELQKKLEEDHSLIPQYTLVALDPEISDDEPVLIDTEALVSAHWKALRSKFSERPIPLIRAVILNALYNTGIKNSYIARIIYLTASNFYPYAKLGREKDIVEKMISELGDVAEKEAIEDWSFVEEESTLKLGALKLKGLNVESVKFEKAVFEKEWSEAFGNAPSGHGPQHGLQNIDYQAHFKTKTTDAITTSIDVTLDNLTKSISAIDIEGPINKFFTEFKKTLDASLKNSFSSVIAVERRSKLLWWKETLYSSSIKDSYRTLDKFTQPIIMAYDLYLELPSITPVSVNFLLSDTLLLLEQTANEKMKFSEYLKNIENDEKKEILKNYFEDKGIPKGRICITDYLNLIVNSETPITNIKEYTGIDESDLVSLSDISVMILRDLMTGHLIQK